MRLSAPKVVTFWIAVALVALGIVATFVPIPFVSAYAFWCEVAGAALLILGAALKGL